MLATLVWTNPTLTLGQHNGQRFQPGLPLYQPAPDCLAMAQDVRLLAVLRAASR